MKCQHSNWRESVLLFCVFTYLKFFPLGPGTAWKRCVLFYIINDIYSILAEVPNLFVSILEYFPPIAFPYPLTCGAVCQISSSEFCPPNYFTLLALSTSDPFVEPVIKLFGLCRTRKELVESSMRDTGNVYW
jgi:hypothetical protein